MTCIFFIVKSTSQETNDARQTDLTVDKSDLIRLGTLKSTRADFPSRLPGLLDAVANLIKETTNLTC